MCTSGFDSSLIAIIKQPKIKMKSTIYYKFPPKFFKKMHNYAGFRKNWKLESEKLSENVFRNNLSKFNRISDLQSTK
jgi:hypothetical protein